MRYISTRCTDSTTRSFLEVVVEGLATDGGLYIPVYMPKIMVTEFVGCRTYADFAFIVMRRFISEDEVDSTSLKDILEKCYHPGSFKTDVVGYQRLESESAGNLRILRLLNLWHGETDAFKDVALQFLGQMMDFCHNKKIGRAAEGKPYMVIGATSGDTGSAAIAGVQKSKNIRCLILYPLAGVSKNQECQMITLANKNSSIQAVAVEGSCFDDCQNYVKELFLKYKSKYNLVAVNSINWCRILAQMVYYWKIAFELYESENKPCTFVVPTGNFGNVLAAHYARQTGAPIADLVIACNENDVLYRCRETGEYSMRTVKKTYSPSMDIQTSSNFERFVHVITGGDGAMVQDKYKQLQNEGKFVLNEKQLMMYREKFICERATDGDTLETMRMVHDRFGIYICPHTAVGVHASLRIGANGEYNGNPSVVASTAKYTKFGEAYEAAFKKTLVLEADENIDQILKTRMVIQKDLNAIIKQIETIISV